MASYRRERDAHTFSGEMILNSASILLATRFIPQISHTELYNTLAGFGNGNC